MARTPIDRLALPGCRHASLWIKRDDRTDPDYGGNKARKLPAVIAEARRRGAGRLVTVGAAGSHHVLATTVFARRAGLGVAAVLAPQPRSTHGEATLAAALALGLDARPVRRAAQVPRALLGLWRRGDLFVPSGGTMAATLPSHLDAAAEVAAAVADGELPAPDVIVVAVGSGGTAAGLAAGVTRARLRSRVRGVVAADPASLLGPLTRLLAAAAGPGRSGLCAAFELEIDRGFLGAGYGVPTAESRRAHDLGSDAGLPMDPSYTAKALAAALELARRPGARVLYWHTAAAPPRVDAALDPTLARALFPDALA
jgi:1-aminocyclopropane-1-carboxylate deaminase/D-cysteine desulfhydrase-like pyridoxal-dependent ACC family enzyme